jgi:hypothetical protein
MPIAMPRSQFVDGNFSMSPTSPQASYLTSSLLTSPGKSSSSGGSASYAQANNPKALTTFVPSQEESFQAEKQTIKALLLENVRSAALSCRNRLRKRIGQVNESGIKLLRNQNYTVDTEKASLGEDELIKRLRDGQYQVLGIRSKTKVTRRVIEECQSVRQSHS